MKRIHRLIPVLASVLLAAMACHGQASDKKESPYGDYSPHKIQVVGKKADDAKSKK